MLIYILCVEQRTRGALSLDYNSPKYYSISEKLFPGIVTRRVAEQGTRSMAVCEDNGTSHNAYRVNMLLDTIEYWKKASPALRTFTC